MCGLKIYKLTLDDLLLDKFPITISLTHEHTHLKNMNPTSQTNVQKKSQFYEETLLKLNYITTLHHFHTIFLKKKSFERSSDTL